MDRPQPLGNSIDTFTRRALHVKIGNLSTEPVPVAIVSENIGEVKNLFAELSSVANGVPTDILTYTVPADFFYLSLIEAAGTNIAAYQILKNGTVIASQWTYFSGPLTADFEFGDTFERGLKFSLGDVIKIRVTHNRPDVGTFSARILGTEVLP